MTAHRHMSTWTRPGRSPSASARTATTSAPSSAPPTWPLHAVAVAVELGDAGQALELAHGINAAGLSAERQARYDIDLAQAHAMRRQTGEALRYLEEAERLTPEQTRTHRAARAVARELIQLSGSRPRPELRELAERLGVLP
jgi:outer membrane PBP1 activator LpoA protein